MVQKKWTLEEIETLKELYPIKPAKEIANMLNRSLTSIRYKISSLGLIKYDVDKSYEAVSVSAKKYNCRSDFKRYDYYMYEIATKNNWLSEVCSHMIFKTPSKPQLYLKELMDTFFGLKGIYNDRKTIKPLELDVYYPEIKLAFEYNGNNWHNDEESIQRDYLKIKMCIEAGIRLIIIEETDKYRYEQNIRNSLIYNGFDISNIQVSIIDKVLNIEQVKSICDRYDNFGKWRLENSWLYHRLYRLQMLDQFTSHMYKRRRL